MTDFWKNQMDYVFFVYGFAFIAVAAVLLGRKRAKEGERFGWNWLLWFGLLHGVNEWMDMWAIGFGDSAAFKWVRLWIMAASFLALFEFGRRGLISGGLKWPGGWLYAIVLPAAAMGYLYGPNGLNASLRYFLGFTGASLTGMVFLRVSGRQPAERGIFHTLAGAAFLLYGASAGLIVPAAGFYPANILNHDAFFAVLGFPVQVLRALCAGVSAFCVWGIFRGEPRKGNEESLWFRAWFLPGCIVSGLIFGVFLVNWQGNIADKEQRGEILSQVRAVARTMNVKDIKALSFTPRDNKNPSFLRLRQQLISYGKAMNLRSIYSMALRDGKIVFGPENIPEG
ncbi:MAG: hypothetical protein HQL30_10715 [Candidatus Omnitrophica bacterium]|nr:hypothetical protein [Candidatus Omnitrophota bacterium]